MPNSNEVNSTMAHCPKCRRTLVLMCAVRNLSMWVGCPECELYVELDDAIRDLRAVAGREKRGR